MHWIIALIVIVVLVVIVALRTNSSPSPRYGHTAKGKYVGNIDGSTVSVFFGQKSQGSITTADKVIKMIYDCQSIIPVDENNVPLKESSCYTYVKNKDNSIVLHVIHDPKNILSVRLTGEM